MADPNNILCIQLGDIGDLVLTLPCLRALRETFPASRIHAAVRDKAADLLRLCPWVDEPLVVSGEPRPFLREIAGQIRFFRSLRARKIDLAIDLRTGDRGALLALLSGARRRIACWADDGTLWRNRLFTDLYRQPYHPDTHVTDYHLAFLAAFGITTRHPRPELQPAERDIAVAGQLLAGEGIATGRELLAVQPFSLWRYKELAAEKYIALIRHLRDTQDVAVLVTGAPAERQRAAAIVDRCGGRVHNLAGKTTLGQYAALLRCCSLFIGVDSVGQHLAAAVGTPTVTIYGPSNPASWAPRGRQHLVIQNSMDCVPCRKTGCAGGSASKCLDLLPAEAIIAAVDRHYQAIRNLQP